MAGPRYICIHGHFYQPPRENPWLEAVEIQDSAYPYHDWNERITAECYAPNARSRILDDQKQIVKIVNNYARMSFNFGPTLLSWLERHAPEVYAAILAADRESRQAFSGHGSALAQVYNHMVMPLASPRDRYTQAVWGIRDFRHRFGRWPEGMWLPETAVDLATLDLLAELGITFTILAAHQVRRIRAIGDSVWRDVPNASVDPRQPYRVALPSGRSLVVFIYDGPISRAVAFERLLNRGEDFAARLVGAFAADRQEPQLVSIATDGESYGHHHRFGDMALAFALDRITTQGLAQVTNYGEYLSKYPPTHEAEIIDNTAWSCAHGVERWRSNCGCNTGSHPGWQQEWRGPLRQAFDWLRDTLAPSYETAAAELFGDPWVARNEYVQVLVERTPEALARFLASQTRHPLSAARQVRARKLLEMQRHLMLMYHSCGWFFDDPSGIETVGVMQCAARAIQLAREVFDDDCEPAFLRRLRKVPSNVRTFGDAARIWRMQVKPAVIDLEAVCAHAAIRSLFGDAQEGSSVYCYTVERAGEHRREAHGATLALGQATVTSATTGESQVLAYGVLHLGGLNLAGGVCAESTAADGEAMAAITAAMSEGDMLEALRLLDHRCHGLRYSLRSLFRDDQRRVIGGILAPTLKKVEALYREFYERSVEILRFLVDNRIPPPEGFREAARYALNSALKRLLSAAEPDWPGIETLIAEARATGVALDEPGLALLLKQAAELAAGRFADQVEDLPRLNQLLHLMNTIQELPFFVDLWEVQNRFYDLRQSAYMRQRDRATSGDGNARSWCDQFCALGEKLHVKVD